MPGGNDSYTKLLCHGNGVDGSTTFVDSSSLGLTMTAFSAAQVDTDQYKFGGASILLAASGLNDYVQSADHVDLDLGTSDFAIDCWVRFPSIPGGNVTIFGRTSSSSSYMYWSMEGGSWRFRDYNSGNIIDFSRTLSMSANTWYHVAVTRNGSNFRMFLDGVQQGATYVNASAITARAVGIDIGCMTQNGAYQMVGWIDEFRYSVGDARWTSDFTPPTEEYSEPVEILDVNELISLSENWEISTNPELLDINEILSLSENWDIHLNILEEIIDENISLNEDWSILINPESQILSETISLSENWIINAFGTYYAKLRTDFRWLQTVVASISASFSWLKAKVLNTDFRWLSLTKQCVSTDFRWLSQAYNVLTPISYTDIQIFINGVDIFLGNDVNLQSGNITHTIGNTSTASFVLARRHDDLDRTHLGVASQITNQNPVQIYIKGHLEFDGYISGISVDSETETVSISAKMDEPEDNRHSIELPLPSVNEKLHLYHCLVNNVRIDNPKEDTRTVIVGNNGRYWNGTDWVFYIEEALLFATDQLAQDYIDDYVDLSVNLIFESKQPSVAGRERNPQYYHGIKVNLGTKIQQQVNRYTFIDYVGIDGKGCNATAIENGTFDIWPNYTYFWAISATLITTGYTQPFGTFYYIGTSLASTTSNLWVLNGAMPWCQKIRDNIETELGYYYVGSAPYKEISPKNGWLITNTKWQDRNNGFYAIKEASYDYRNYAKLVAGLEYQKLQNVHGDILPVTSASLDITFDAYYYYNVKLLTRINVTNTTVANSYNNLNGFPVSVKSININFASMKITLITDNRLSQEEIDELDAQMPDEESSLYITKEHSTLILRKFDLRTKKYVS